MNLCFVVVAAAKNVAEHMGPATVRIVVGKPQNEFEEVLSEAVRDGLRRIINHVGLADTLGRQ